MRVHHFHYFFFASNMSLDPKELIAILASIVVLLLGVILFLQARARSHSRVHPTSQLRSEAIYRMLVDHATDAFFLQDENYLILDVNEQACLSLGFPREELIGKSPIAFDVNVTLEVLELFRPQLQTLEVVEFETHHRRKDGTEFPVEVRARGFKEDGRILIVALARDITERRRTQTALRESEERFRSTFENAGVGIALCDIEGNLVRVNDRFADIVGYAGAELTGKSYREITHIDDVTIDIEQIKLILTGDLRSYSIEKRYIRKDRSHVWVLLSASVLQRDSGGSPVSLIAIIEDITTRKRLQEDLNDANERLGLAVRGSNLTIWELDMPDGNVEGGRSIHVNGWEPLGYDPSEAPATFSEMYALLVDPQEHPRVSVAIDDCLSGRTNGYEVEYRVRHKNGSYRWHLARGMALRSTTGPRVRFIGSTVDVTDLKHTEAALRESEARFRGTFENAAVGIGHIGPEGRWVRVNQRLCDIVGYTRQELLGVTFQDITHSDDLLKSLDPFLQLWQGNIPNYSLEKRYTRKDGSSIWVETTVSLQRDSDGSPTYTIAIIQDVTERKRLEEDSLRSKEVAETANRAKDEFLANVSHEIRTPMNAILGMTELVLDTALAEGQRQALKTVKSAADSLLGLISDLLDFSKIEAGKLTLESVAFSLRTVVGDTLRALAVRAHRKDVELVSYVQSEIPDALVGDAARFRQLLTNLVDNAIKFTKEGEVVVRVEAEGGAGRNEHITMRLSVADTGIGISSEKQQIIFQAFEQEDGSTTRNYGGTGLGLTIAAQIAQAMGGQIRVESELGKGSVFTFVARFRICANDESTELASVTLIKGLRVLIVEDNVASRDILIEMLEGWQLKTTVVGDGMAAIKALSRAAQLGTAYSLVLIDGGLSDGNGTAVAKMIRSHPSVSSTRLILIDSGEHPSDVAKGSALRIDAHLVKPVQQNELLDAICRVACGMTVMRNNVTQQTASPIAIVDCGLPSLRILVAEDNVLSAQFMEMMLGHWGHCVQIASDGIEALEWVAKGGFDLLLLDIHMPGMDGFEVIEAIRKCEASTGMHLPVIALTARSRQEDRSRGLACGMDDFLVKPLDAADLRAALKRISGNAPGGDQSGILRIDQSVSVVNASVLVATCGGDDEILSAMCSSLRSYLPSQLLAIEQAARDRCLPQLRDATHNLAGIVAAFSSVTAEVARQLEDAALTDRRHEYLALASKLDNYGRALLDELHSVSIETLSERLNSTSY